MLLPHLQHPDQLPLLAPHAAQLMQWLAKLHLGPRKGANAGAGEEMTMALLARLAPFAEQPEGVLKLEVCTKLLAHACG